MINANFAKIAASSLALGTVFVGLGPVGQEFVTEAVAGTSTQNVAGAEKAAKDARKALTKGDAQKAVAFAEKAAGLSPQSVNYRMLLGEAYLAAGRFASAEASYADVMSLSPGSDRAALRLALTKIAQGEVDSARALIEENKPTLATADYGLAIALAGDVDGAIATLEDLIRTPASDARARQNLALAYALAGKWAQARVLASQDLSPDLVDGRMSQWALLARPKTSYDQVASVLGVKPAYDPGQPVYLALNGGNAATQVAVRAAVAKPVPVAAAALVQQEPAPLFETAGSSSAVAQAAPAPAAAPAQIQQASNELRTFEFAPRQEVVQPLPANYRRGGEAAPLVRAQRKPMKTALASSVAPRTAVASPRGRPMIVEVAKPRTAVAAVKPTVKPAAKPVQTVVAANGSKSVKAGEFVVQLGAFGSKAQAEAAWKTTSGKVGKGNAVTAQVNVNGKTFQRLAVSGFGSAAEANAVCAKVKAAGGQCLVKGANSDGSRWASLKPGKPVQLASR